jgi:hypothetical protein
LHFSIDEHAPRLSPETRSEGCQAPSCGTSLVRLITVKLDARRAVGEPLDKVASLHDHVQSFE